MTATPLSELKRLLLMAVNPPDLDNEVKREWRFKAGYALGFTHALEEAIQILEEAEEDEAG